jgi:hypothetical protein
VGVGSGVRSPAFGETTSIVALAASFGIPDFEGTIAEVPGGDPSVKAGARWRLRYTITPKITNRHNKPIKIVRPRMASTPISSR